MERIVIEVNENAAKKWRFASSKNKERLAKSIGLLIDKVNAEDEDGFWEFVEKISQQAASRGLTEQELENLLNEQ